MSGRRKPRSAPPGGPNESFELVDLGEPKYRMELPPGGSVVTPVPVEDPIELVDLGEPKYRMELPPGGSVVQTGRKRSPEGPQENSPTGGGDGGG
jgi:hypothetical protein